MMKKNKIAVIGLGYVGLPLAVEFAKKYRTIGFDINNERINKLRKGIDSTLEVSKNDLQSVLVSDFSETKETGLIISDQKNILSDANIYIVTVPTPTDKHKRPILTPLYKASETIGSFLKKDDIVIYESTVYPGVTEDECVPVLERTSNLEFNKDFFVGYSPERINPGDKERTITKILKVTSGSNKQSALKIDQLYKSVITAGTHLAPSIKVAEAAKVIENSQRDINIAFVNELAKIFNLLDIDTNAVLEAACTKWNFLNFKPGLVGGHCIGVDPYYLAQKAQEVGYHPEIILSGRRLNDSMGVYVADQMVKLMLRNDVKVKNSEVLILGITFKENCPDIRNTKVIDVIRQLEDYGINITVYDPWAKIEEVDDEYSIVISKDVPSKKFDGIVLAVSHNEFLSLDIKNLKKNNSVVYDVKGFIGDEADEKL